MEGYLGQILMVGYNFAPKNWAFCNGQSLSIAQNTALFSLIGTTYGGNGTTAFNLPNLQGRVPVHVGTLQGGSSYTNGQTGGAEQITLTTQQMPIHNHTVTVDNEPASTPNPTGAYIAQVQDANNNDPTPSFFTGTPQSPVQLVQNTIGNAGGNTAHENRQPFLVVNFIICLQGLFPSRS